MIIIVSTKHLSNTIKKCLDTSIIDIDISKEGLIFSGDKQYTVVCETKVGHDKRVWHGKFQPIQWYKVMKFLEQLEEQPIVIDLDNYGEERHERPSFTLKQFEISF